MTAPACDLGTLIGVCAGSCGRRLHRRRKGDPHGLCADGHPVAECGIKSNAPLCPTCRRQGRHTPATRPNPPGGASGGQGWRTRATCRDEDPELFFPVHGGGPQRDRQVAAAKTVCARCPVQTDCLQEALARGPYHGVWGGLDEPERRQLIVAGVLP